ncbi:hypothetical protein HRI_000299600 [Hibiscus trionum]|uniref:RRM domain-containing protein n=1 Tax=Hibiscus trionum TaxID=183268 RepID=A0A9W7LIQ1_HIBTR|nr:hypothetical protein HRI_000299600 [Hibiscus trionum]
MAERGRNGGVITLFVNNLPTKLHWSGLRQTFRRHGDLVDFFIAKKRDKAGRRFGFVRFANRKDANRTMERLDGFRLYGFRLSVSIAKNKRRNSFWRNVRNNSNQSREERRNSRTYVPTPKPMEEQRNKDRCPRKQHEHSEERGKNSNRFNQSSKNIVGHVEEESLWRLSKCLIGTMTMVCSPESVKRRLQSWGLRELVVRSLGGQKFLIEIKDEELLKLLEDHKWSLLEEVFIEIENWTEAFRLSERITWVEVQGIPLHVNVQAYCWHLGISCGLGGERNVILWLRKNDLADVNQPNSEN